MGRFDIIIGVGVTVLLLSVVVSADGEIETVEEVFPESGVIFTEPSIDDEGTFPPLGTPTMTTTTTTTLPPFTQNPEKTEEGISVTQVSSSIGDPVSSPVVPVSSPVIPTTPRSKVPPSFRKYIDAIRGNGPQVNGFKSDEIPVPVALKQEEVKNVDSMPNPVPPVTERKVPLSFPPVNLPQPPIKEISAMIRDIEQKQRQYKDIHPKLHLHPLRFGQKPNAAPADTPPTGLLRAVDDNTSSKGVKVPTPSSTNELLTNSNNKGRWFWNLLGMGESSGKSVSSPPPTGPPASILPAPKPTEAVDEFGVRIILKPAEHPEPGQGYYECPFIALKRRSLQQPQQKRWLLF